MGISDKKQLKESDSEQYSDGKMKRTHSEWKALETVNLKAVEEWRIIQLRTFCIMNDRVNKDRKLN